MIFEKDTREQGKHYLYIHIRLDNDNIFYVGIGTKYNHNKDYTRAKAKGTQRNYIWRGIASRTEYKVKILFENNDYNFIKQKEIELIAKHGQIIKNTGTLCNLNDGGDGMLGVRNLKQIKPVFLYKKSGEFYKEFESFVDCNRFLKVSKSIVKLSINKNFLIKGFILKDYRTEKVHPIMDIKEKLKKRLSKRVFQYNINGTFIKEWESTSEASRILKISGGHIRECAKGNTNRKTAGSFVWKYN